ncbi:MAG TPA: hypothetical protein VNA12_06235 [Mycobacteriales bacterium]|nr:hypothetical protein [Mycobacteriales bacterium]
MGEVRLLVAALALGSLVAPPLAEARTKPRTVHFTVPFDDEGSLPYGIHQCGLERTGACDFKFDGHTTITGDLTTFIDYFGYFHVDPVTRIANGESWDRHTGSLKGCGTGSFVWHQYELVGDFNAFDPVTRTVPFSIKWRILPGSGTGDFAGATGSGTGEARATLQFANKGTYTGSITCPRGTK